MWCVARYSDGIFYATYGFQTTLDLSQRKATIYFVYCTFIPMLFSILQHLHQNYNKYRAEIISF